MDNNNLLKTFRLGYLFTLAFVSSVEQTVFNLRQYPFVVSCYYFLSFAEGWCLCLYFEIVFPKIAYFGVLQSGFLSILK